MVCSEFIFKPASFPALTGMANKSSLFASRCDLQSISHADTTLDFIKTPLPSNDKALTIIIKSNLPTVDSYNLIITDS